MSDDLLPLLTRFHREVIAPEMKRVVAEAVDGLEARMNTHFDAINQRFDRLETALERRRRDGLLRSLRHPHRETADIAKAGLADWGSSLPADEGLVVLGQGTAVLWEEGKGWRKR